MDWYKIGQLGLGAISIIVLGYLFYTAIQSYFASKQAKDDTGTTEALEKNTEAFRELTGFLKEFAASEKVWREVEAERILSILGKVDQAIHDINAGNNVARDILERLKERPCQLPLGKKN